MRYLYNVIAAAALVLVLASPEPVAGQELTDTEEALIAAQAQRHVELYYNYFYERDPESLATDIFTLPWITLGGNGVSITMSEAENLASFKSSIEGLLERDWDRSIYTTKSVCVLTTSSALVSGTNTRTRADGSIMSVGGVTYILGKTDAGWRIISFSGHSPGKVVRCDSE
jgi:hypothetical protein